MTKERCSAHVSQVSNLNAMYLETECRNFDGRILHVMTLSRDGSCKIAKWRKKSGTQFKRFYRDKLIRINKRSRANTDGISSPFVFLPIQLCTIHFPAVLLPCRFTESR